MRHSTDEFVAGYGQISKLAPNGQQQKPHKKQENQGVTKTNGVELDRMGCLFFFSKRNSRGKRDIGMDEIDNIEEEIRTATTFSQFKQFDWTTWSDIDPINQS